MRHQADLETIVMRLVEIDRRVQRQLRQLAATLGLTLDDFLGLRHHLPRQEPAEVARVAVDLERRLPAGFDGDRLARPEPSGEVRRWLRL